MNVSKIEIQDLTDQISRLADATEALTTSLNQTDDFNNWTMADSFASIAGALVQANSLEKKKRRNPIPDQEFIKHFMKNYFLSYEEARDLLEPGDDYDKFIATWKRIYNVDEEVPFKIWMAIQNKILGDFEDDPRR